MPRTGPMPGGPGQGDPNRKYPQGGYGNYGPGAGGAPMPPQPPGGGSGGPWMPQQPPSYPGPGQGGAPGGGYTPPRPPLPGGGGGDGSPHWMGGGGGGGQPAMGGSQGSSPNGYQEYLDRVGYQRGANPPSPVASQDFGPAPPHEMGGPDNSVLPGYGPGGQPNMGGGQPNMVDVGRRNPRQSRGGVLGGRQQWTPAMTMPPTPFIPPRTYGPRAGMAGNSFPMFPPGTNPWDIPGARGPGGEALLPPGTPGGYPHDLSTRMSEGMDQFGQQQDELRKKIAAGGDPYGQEGPSWQRQGFLA